MGLFNFIFGSSTKEQEEPIRDKLKGRKYFKKQLQRNLRLRAITEESITEAKENNNEKINMTFLYGSLGENSIYNIKIKYSMDTDIIELQKVYLDSLGYFIVGCEMDNPIYDDILNRVSLGILLNIPDENFRQLIDYVQRVDEQAKPTDWTPDLLLWFMLNSRLQEEEQRTYAEKLAFPKLYKGLYKVTQAADKEEAQKALKDYLGKWYNLNKDAPWYNNHLRDNGYSGYWAWEIAAVAKIMHIDDFDLKDNPYYPYDMVHWEDTVNQ